ncbi:hypothetical protein EDB19DRAFT_542445 [Suillus lakei]|nr:hypothetical protein EDB19DRAFT_542445 [Suillus lakei]
MATTNPTASSSTPLGESRPERISSDGNNGEPWHDVLPKYAFLRLCYKALCMIAVSKSSVDHWHYLTERPIKKEWIAHKEMVINRFENMNVTAGLVLTTSAVFISTNPRKLFLSCRKTKKNLICLFSLAYQPLMPYASHGSYILQVSSFVAALISLMTGTSVLIIYDTCYAHDRILKSLMHSRWRRVCCLILMAYPSLALAASTLALITAVLIAGLTSDKLFVKILAAVTYFTLIILVVLAGCAFGGPVIAYVLLHIAYQSEFIWVLLVSLMGHSQSQLATICQALRQRPAIAGFPTAPHQACSMRRLIQINSGPQV